MMRPKGERAVVEHGVARDAERHVPAAGGYAVPACSNPNDRFVHPSVDGGRDRSHQIVGNQLRAGDLRGAPVKPHAGAGRFERRQAPSPASRRSCPREHRRCPRWPARPAPAARIPAARRAKRPTYPVPYRRQPRRTGVPLPARAPAWSPANWPNSSPELALMRRDDRILAAQPLGLAEMRDRVGIDDLRRREVSARVNTCGKSPRPGPPAGSRCARRSPGRVDLDDRGRQVHR